MKRQLLVLLILGSVLIGVRRFQTLLVDLVPF